MHPQHQFTSTALETKGSKNPLQSPPRRRGTVRSFTLCFKDGQVDRRQSAPGVKACPFTNNPPEWLQNQITLTSNDCLCFSYDASLTQLSPQYNSTSARISVCTGVTQSLPLIIKPISKTSKTNNALPDYCYYLFSREAIFPIPSLSGKGLLREWAWNKINMGHTGLWTKWYQECTHFLQYFSLNYLV